MMDGIVVSRETCGPDGWPFPCTTTEGWHPVDPNVSPWLVEQFPYTLARCWVVACGPELLRVADAE
jgi:hypothetical protein